MTSEIRTNSLKSRAGLSTVTLTDSGPMFSGITTFVDNSGFNLGTGSSIFSPATNTLTFGTNSNERVRIDSSGRMGLGTDSPEEILHVKAASETVNSRDGVIFQSSSALAADTGLPLVFSSHIGNDPNYPVASIAGRKENASSGDGAGYLQLATGSSAGAISEKARIDSSGRVLIGTTTEGYSSADDLTISTSGTTGITIRSGTSNTGTLAFSDGTSGADEYRGYIQYEHQNDALAFGSNGTERFRIDSNGHFKATNGSTSDFNTIQRASTSNYVGIRIQDADATQRMQIGVAGGTNNICSGAAQHDVVLKSYANLLLATNQTERFRITSGGCFFGNNIGIGTDNRWKIRPNTSYTELAFEYSTNTALADTNIKMALKSDSVDVLSDFAIKSSLAKMSMIDTDGGDYFQLRNDGGTFKIRNSTDGRDDISITNNNLTVGGVLSITDNNSIFFGASQDIEFRHNATSSQNQLYSRNHDFLLQSYGTIYMQCYQSGNSTNGNVLTANYNAGTALYYQNGERIVTTNAGCKISNGLVMDGWLNISRNGTYAPASVGHTANSAEGIFWHSAIQYSIFRNSGTWGGPNYQQLNLNWPTGIHIDGGYNYGLSGARFNCHTLPYANNSFDLGTSALRWRDVYCNQGAFNNSDIELKQDIASLTAAEMKAAKRLSALFKTYRWKDAVEEKGTDKARTHTGMIAQQIQAAMSAEGLDATKYGLFGTDEWYENDKKEIITLDQLRDDIPDPLDSSKTVTPPSIEGYTKVTRYSVRYTELLSFIAAYNDQRFADLESRVASLQESITKVETLEQDNIALRARVTNLEGN